MTVGFYHVALDGPKASTAGVQAMVRSVKQAMPGVRIVHFTDVQTPVIDGVDWAVRPTLPVALGCLDAYAQCEGDWLFLDTDVIVREDVRHVFDQPFDIAVAERAGTLKPSEVDTKFMASMPYNKGAVFSRSQAFWLDALARCRQMKPTRQQWMGDQQAMNDAILSGKYAVEVLPNRYNYPPLTATDDLRDKAIVHYKGPRKAWMGLAA